MGHSSLLGIDTAAAAPAGRTNVTLGPSDSSDSGSDVAGLAADEEDDDNEDLNTPVDVALRADGMRNLMPSDAMSGAASDAAGTGESRSAGADAGNEAADIGVDRVFTPGSETDDAGEVADEDEDADLMFIDRMDQLDLAQAGGLEDEDDSVPGATLTNREPRSSGPVDPDEPEEPENPDDPPEDPEPDGEPPEPDDRRPGRASNFTNQGTNQDTNQAAAKGSIKASNKGSHKGASKGANQVPNKGPSSAR